MAVSTGITFPVLTSVAVWLMFQDCKIVCSPYRETNSGVRGVWVYEIGTSPYFSNVAPGEVTDLPTEATPQGPPEDNEEATDARRTVYTNGQQAQDPPYETEGAQIEIHPIQYQPLQPNNPEVLVVDDTDINVDGESTGEALYLLEDYSYLMNKLFLLYSYHAFSCFQCFHTTWGLVQTTETSAPSLLTARTTPVDTAATADLASMAMGYSVWQKVMF